MMVLTTKRFLFIVFLIVTVLSCLLLPTQLRAVTVTGTDIRVDYIGTAGPTDLTYRVSVIVYTQCDNSGTIALRPSIDITVSSVSEQMEMDMTLQRLPPQDGDTISSVCPSISPRHSCYDPSLMSQRPGFIKTTYTGVISLPKQAEDWVFYYYHLGNGRGNTSINLCSSMIMHVAALCYFNNKTRYNNSSPRFTVNPIRYLGANQPAKIYNGPVDPDMDSIVVRKNSSLGCLNYNGSPCPNCGLFSEVDYVAGYTVDQPVMTIPPNSYQLSSEDGTASFTPATGGSFAFGFRCEEYDRRSGQLLGYVIRDIAIPIFFFTGGDFSLDSIASNVTGAIQAPQGTNSLVVCPGTPVTFNIGAQTGTGAVYLVAERPTAPASTFVVTGNGGNSPSGQFSWTPGVNDIGQHNILVKAIDSACSNLQYPFVHEKYTVVTINVIRGIELGPDKDYCAFSGIPMQLAPETIIPGIRYKWTKMDGSPAEYMDNDNVAAPFVQPPHTSGYRLRVEGLPPSCKQTDSITVRVDNSSYVQIKPESPLVLCNGEQLNLEATAYGLPPFQNYACDLTGEAPNTPLTTIDPEPIGTGMISGANPQSTPFNDLATSRHQYLVRATDLLRAGMHSGTLTGMSLFLSGNTSGATFNDFKIHLKCTPMTALNPNAFETGSVPVFASNAFTVPASGRIDIDFDAWYNWDTAQNLIVEICYTRRNGSGAVLTDAYPTIYTSCLYTSNATGNSVCGGGVSSTGPSVVNELPRMSFRYHPAPEADFSYAWLRVMGNYVSDTTSRTPTMSVTERTKYYVFSQGRNGCLLRDSLDVFVSERNFGVSPEDTLICIGDTILITTSGGHTFRWYEGNYQASTSLDCNDCGVVRAAPIEETRYALVIKDELDCADTLEVNVDVLEASKVDILNKDTLIRYGDQVKLVAVGAETYRWTPALYLNDPAIASPWAAPQKDMLYIVRGSTGGLCSSQDSVWIRIDYRGRLLVPGAFSPNGDGLNDLFRVENLSFQKIAHFSVFNRYGQEVYQAAPGETKGWDGTWKGKMMDIGTYFYQIEIVYPDGLREQYKGDVVLMR